MYVWAIMSNLLVGSNKCVAYNISKLLQVNA